MTRLAALALLGSVAALPAAAQTTWTHPNLVFLNGTMGGCNLQLVQATTAGGAMSPIFVSLQNRGARPAQVMATVQLRDATNRKSGNIGPTTIQPNAVARVQTIYPFGGSLDATTLTVTITRCTPQ